MAGEGEAVAEADVSGIVDDLGIEAPQQEEETEAEVTAEETEAPAAPVAEKPAHKLFVDDALFTDEALKSPEGIGKARDVLLAKQVQMNRGYGRLKTRETKVENRARMVDRREVAIVRLGDGLMSDINQLEAGDATAIINTLGKLCRRDGAAVYEMLTQNILANGKKAKPTAGEAALRAEIDQLKARDLQKEQQAEQQRVINAENTARQRLHGAASNAETYPTVARFIAQKPAEVVNTLVEMKIAHHAEHGTVLDDGEALRTLESQLARAIGQTGPAPDAGREPSRTKPANQAARLGKTVSPSRALTASSRRTVEEMSDEERMVELARDPGDLLAQLGL